MNKWDLFGIAILTLGVGVIIYYVIQNFAWGANVRKGKFNQIIVTDSIQNQSFYVYPNLQSPSVTVADDNLKIDISVENISDEQQTLFSTLSFDGGATYQTLFTETIAAKTVGTIHSRTWNMPPRNLPTVFRLYASITADVIELQDEVATTIAFI